MIERIIVVKENFIISEQQTKSNKMAESAFGTAAAANKEEDIKKVVSDACDAAAAVRAKRKRELPSLINIIKNEDNNGGYGYNDDEDEESEIIMMVERVLCDHQNKSECFELLTQADNDGNTPLHLTIVQGYDRILMLLVLYAMRFWKRPKSRLAPQPNPYLFTLKNKDGCTIREILRLQMDLMKASHAIALYYLKSDRQKLDNSARAVANLKMVMDISRDYDLC